MQSVAIYRLSGYPPGGVRAAVFGICYLMQGVINFVVGAVKKPRTDAGQNQPQFREESREGCGWWGKSSCGFLCAFTHFYKALANLVGGLLNCATVEIADG